MRKLLGLVAAGAIALSLTPAHAAKDTIKATLLAPSPTQPPTGPQGIRDNCVVPVLEGRDPLETCEKDGVTIHARCLFLLAEQVDPTLAQDGDVGKIGYVIDVKKSWWGEDFTLRNIQADQPVADFDVVFFTDLGTCEGSASSMLGPPPIRHPILKSGFAHIGDESGSVTPDASAAVVVCQCANARFEFEVTGL